MKIVLSNNPAIAFLDIYQRDSKSTYYRDMHMDLYYSTKVTTAGYGISPDVCQQRGLCKVNVEFIYDGIQP